MNSKILSIVGALSLTAFSAAQACEISARVSVVGNEFPAIQTVGAGAVKG
jgi:trehalose/maltose transport system substrate-binding protein